MLNTKPSQQRLGSLVLQQDDDQEIELFEWTGLAAEAVTLKEKMVEEARVLSSNYQETAFKLQQQIDDFITSRGHHERQMLEQFRLLLNAKKLKIRDQQRLLAGAKVDVRAGTIHFCMINGPCILTCTRQLVQ